MNIIFICGAGIVSGKERQTLNTMQELKNNGHVVSCITASWGDGEFAKLLGESGIPFTRERLGFISKTLSFSAMWMTLHQAIYLPSLWIRYLLYVSRVKPDVIVHTNFHHIVLLLPLLNRPKQAFIVHDYFFPSSFYVKLFSLFDWKIDLFIGVSSFIQDSIKKLGIGGDKIDMVYNGVMIPKLAVRSAIEAGNLRVGIVGQVTQMKGHELLIQAIIPLLRKHSKLQLHIIGSGNTDFMEKLEALASSEGLLRQILFRGRLNTLEEIYDGMTIICVPSLLNESFGLTAVEPGFFRIPVICTDRGALPEVVKNGVTGMVIPAGNSNEIYKALEYMLSHPDKRVAMGEAGFERVTALFSIKKNTIRLGEILTDLVTNR